MRRRFGSLGGDGASIRWAAVLRQASLSLSRRARGRMNRLRIRLGVRPVRCRPGHTLNPAFGRKQWSRDYPHAKLTSTYANLRYQEAVCWQKWTKGGCEAGKVAALAT